MSKVLNPICYSCEFWGSETKQNTEGYTASK